MQEACPSRMQFFRGSEVRTSLACPWLTSWPEFLYARWSDCVDFDFSNIKPVLREEALLKVPPIFPPATSSLLPSPIYTTAITTEYRVNPIGLIALTHSHWPYILCSLPHSAGRIPILPCFCFYWSNVSYRMIVIWWNFPELMVNIYRTLLDDR